MLSRAITFTVNLLQPITIPAYISINMASTKSVNRKHRALRSVDGLQYGSEIYLDSMTVCWILHLLLLIFDLPE